MSVHRQGLIYGVSAYLLWGLFPLYWPLLKPAGAIEILAHRMIWSLFFVALLVLVARRWPHLIAVFRAPRKAALLALAATLVSVNWGTYIWGVNNHHVVDTALGYFINPLVTVVFGVLILGEQLRRGQWLAIGVATVAVVGLTIEYGRPPWVALTLAVTFGTYGLVKKKAGVEAVESLAFETLCLAPIAAGYLLWLGPGNHFVGYGADKTALFVGAGLVTLIPLLLFSASAIRIPLSTLGLIQYLTPIMQFLLGITFLGEHMSAMRWAGFILVWFALVIFTVEAVLHQRARNSRPNDLHSTPVVSDSARVNEGEGP